MTSNQVLSDVRRSVAHYNSWFESDCFPWYYLYLISKSRHQYWLLRKCSRIPINFLHLTVAIFACNLMTKTLPSLSSSESHSSPDPSPSLSFWSLLLTDRQLSQASPTPSPSVSVLSKLLKYGQLSYSKTRVTLYYWQWMIERLLFNAK